MSELQFGGIQEMGCSLGRRRRDEAGSLSAGLTGMPRSSQPAIAADQAFLALKRFFDNRRQRPALSLSRDSGGTPSAMKEGGSRGILMSEKALRAALVRSVVLTWL